MKIKYRWLILIILGIVFLEKSPAFAAEMNFSVRAIIPTNQIDKTQTYFDLRMKPNQEQDLLVEMNNSTQKPVTVNVIPNTATTNDNGVVEYNNIAKKADRSLKYAFKDLAKVDNQTVTIPANSHQQIKVHLKMPAESFDGVILGGIYFKEKTDDNLQDNRKDSQIINQYAYVIGVKLTETDTPVNPQLRLVNVKPSQVNYRNVINAQIQNYQAAIIEKMKVSGQIYRKGHSKVLYSDTRDNLRMAPNSNFNFGISLNNKEFAPGKYTFKGVATIGKQKWHFSRDFEIEGQVARSYNHKAVSLEKDYTKYYIIGGLIVVLILIVIILILVRKLQKNKVSASNN